MPDNSNDSDRCPECGRPNRCGRAAGCGNCWCFDIKPRLPMPTDPAARCLCESCLRKRVESGEGRVES